MQGDLCAYCEASLEISGRHIDHHVPKSQSPRLTFDWTNLLGSCARNDSCGHFKDRADAPERAGVKLVDPSAEDPDDYFIIRYDGKVEPRTSLTAVDRRRAETTIAALNLNDEFGTPRRLVGARKRVLEFYLKRDPDVLSALECFSAEERQAFIASELAAVSAEPFSSIIRHFFAR